MSEKRFNIKPQDDYWAVVDDYNEDKVCIINGIHTKIEAIWLCALLNDQQATISRLEEEKIELNEENKRLNAFLVHNGFAEEYIRWKREDKEQILIFSLHKEQLGVVCDLLNEQQVKLEIFEKILPKQLPVECQKCKFFVTYRNFNYEKMTNDTITIYCDLLQNKETYDRDTGDEIWENGWLNECPLRKGGFYE